MRMGVLTASALHAHISMSEEVRPDTEASLSFSLSPLFWTQGITHSRQVLCHWVILLALLSFTGVWLSCPGWHSDFWFSYLNLLNSWYYRSALSSLAKDPRPYSTNEHSNLNQKLHNQNQSLHIQNNVQDKVLSPKPCTFFSNDIIIVNVWVERGKAQLRYISKCIDPI